MRLIIDQGIPFLDGVFPSDIEVLHLPPEAITPLGWEDPLEKGKATDFSILA